MGRISQLPSNSLSTNSNTSPNYVSDTCSNLEWNNDKQKRRKKSQDEDNDISLLNTLQNCSEHEMLETFQVVTHDLATKSTVGWHNAGQSLSSALKFIHHRDTQTFLQECFRRIISIMLDQHPSKIGEMEQQCVVKCLSLSIPIIIHQLEAKCGYPVSSLSMVFNKRRTYYKDLRATSPGAYWSRASGAPEVRSQCIALFCDLKGFDLLVRYLSLPTKSDTAPSNESSISMNMDTDEGCCTHLQEIESVNSEVFRICLQALLDNYHAVSKKVATQLCVTIMTILSGKSDVALRKESNESVGGILHIVRRLINVNAIHDAAALYDNWLLLTYHYIESESLPLRLFGLEQVHRLVCAAQIARTHPKQYLVQNAGISSVNGLYDLKISENEDNSSATYVMQHDNTRKLVTLFACSVNNGERWWFISESDQINSGTELEVDYYRHPVHADDRLPPTSGWMTADEGTPPLPEIVPYYSQDEANCCKGETNSCSYNLVFGEWVLRNKILDKIFGDRVHREVISRSVLLVKFMAETERLTRASLELIWQTGIQPDRAITDEIHQLIVTAIPYLKDDLLLYLFDTMLVSSRENGFQELIFFVERLSCSTTDICKGRSEVVNTAILNMFWSILLLACTENTKLNQSLRACFRQHLQHGESEVLRKQFLAECIQGIKKSCEGSQSMTTSTFSKVPTMTTSKALEMLKFLIDSYDELQTPSVIELLDEEHGMVTLLFDELATFVHGMPSAEKQNDCYRTAVGHRLDLIYYLHVKSAKLILGIREIKRLWQILSSSALEREFCFIFLHQMGIQSLGMRQANQPSLDYEREHVASYSTAPNAEYCTAPSLDTNVCLYIFLDLLCSQTDMRGIGRMGYKCFHTFFVGLNAQRKRMEIGSVRNQFEEKNNVLGLLGLHALWEIAFSAPKDVSETAIQELLLTYEHFISETKMMAVEVVREAVKEFLQRVFDQLRKIIDAPIGEEALKLVEHCTRLLSGLIQCGVVAPNEPNSISNGCSHILRGRGAVFDLKVVIQCIPPACSAVKDDSSSIDRAMRSIYVRVYSYQPLAILRLQLEQETAVAASRCKILCDGGSITGDAKHLQELGICEASELRLLIFSSAVSGVPELPVMSAYFSDMTEEVQTSLSPGVLIAENADYFDTLFRILDRVVGLQVHSALWTLLSILPTNHHLLRLVSEIGNEDSTMDGDAELRKLLFDTEASSLHCGVYALQILDAMLLPSALSRLKEARAFQRVFVRRKGFQYVFQYLLNGKVSNVSFNDGLATALKIVKYCLFDGVNSDLLMYPAKVLGEWHNKDSSLCVEANLVDEALIEPDLASNDYVLLVHKIIELIVSEYRGLYKYQNHGVKTYKLLMGGHLRSKISKHGYHGDPPKPLPARSCGPFPKILVDTIKSIQAIVSVKPLAADELFAREEVREMVTCVLMFCQNVTVRKQWVLMLQSACNASSNACNVVFECVHSGIERIEEICAPSDQLFQVMQFFVCMCNSEDTLNLDRYCLQLGRAVLMMLRKGFSSSFVADSERYNAILAGFLEFLRQILSIKEWNCEELADEIVDALFDDCLFTLPTEVKSEPQKRRSHCCTMESRRLAFKLLATAITCKTADTNLVALETLHKKLSNVFHRDRNFGEKWMQQNLSEARKRGEHVGLKNQGCSCYINSFLQQLYMHPAIRQGLMGVRTPAPSQTELPSREEIIQFPKRLVGSRVSFKCGGGRYYEADVVHFDAASGQHTFQYDDGNEISFVLEKGYPHELNTSYSVLASRVNGNDATLEVLRQVQRTFCFLGGSEMRCFDPKALVDACKCLNLEFSVYQQNDASEFCDKLLDRLEIGLKNTPQGPRCLQDTLDGKLIAQKLPKDCGHRYEREEAFIRLELQIYGKESIEESLASFVQGEVMDGDNKVECELCGTKKAAIRRTCFGTLPNLLILHLKRFDLDYNTFETVKLNNRCSFPLKLNMKPYTKVGLEQREHALTEPDVATDDQRPVYLKDDDHSCDDEESTNSEFLYRLKGILVHSGVAQGGHYYSFIYDHESDRWFRFDDEDVTLFDPAKIEEECFGGLQRRSWYSTGKVVDVEVYSNALMLFYEKEIPIQTNDRHEQQQHNLATSTASSKQLTQDTQRDRERQQIGQDVMGSPYEVEVRRSNEAFLQTTYLLDSELHEFLLELVQSKYVLRRLPMELAAKKYKTDAHLILAKIGTEFLYSVMLHAHDKHHAGRWISVLSATFENSSAACIWYLEALVGAHAKDWLITYLYECPDTIARQSFVHLTSRVIEDIEANLGTLAMSDEIHLRTHLLLTALTDKIMEGFDAALMGDALLSEDLFLLLRCMAERSEFVRQHLLAKDMIARCARVFLRDRAPLALRNAFPMSCETPQHDRCLDITYDEQLLGSIVAILGIRRRVPEPLLTDSLPHYCSSVVALSVKAKHALTQVFEDYATDCALTESDLINYFTQCMRPVSQLYVEKHSSFRFRNFDERANRFSPDPYMDQIIKNVQAMIDRYGSVEKNCIQLDGFLQYYTNVSSTCPQQVLEDLQALGFNYDFERYSHAPSVKCTPMTMVSALSRYALLSDTFIETALEQDAEVVRDMFVQISMQDLQACISLIHAILQSIHCTENGWKGQPTTSTLCQMLQHILSLNQEHQYQLIEQVLVTDDYALLLTALKSERTRQRSAHPNRISLYIYRQIVIIIDLSERLGELHAYLHGHRDLWVWMYDWLRIESLKSILGGCWSTMYREASKLDMLARLRKSLDIPYNPESRSYTVEGTGADAVDGVYNSTERCSDGCQMFSCTKGAKTFLLYRYFPPSKPRGWYISHCENIAGRSVRSEDYIYFVQAAEEDVFPPHSGWKTSPKCSDVNSPTPTVRLSGSTVESLDSPHHPLVPKIPSLDMLITAAEEAETPILETICRGSQRQHQVSKDTKKYASIHQSMDCDGDLGMIISDDDLDVADVADAIPGDVENNLNAAGNGDSEDEIRVSNEMFRAVRLEEQSYNSPRNIEDDYTEKFT